MTLTTLSTFKTSSEMESNLQNGVIPFMLGIPNDDNASCYMNACIASLCTSKKFASLFGSTQIINVTGKDTLVNKFVYLISSLFCNNDKNIRVYKREFATKLFKHSIENNGNFTKGRQQDSQEFFLFLIHWIQELIKRTREETFSQYEFLRQATTCLDNFFFNKRRKTTCINGHVSYKDDLKQVIILPIERNINSPFDQLISNYFREYRTRSCVCHINSKMCDAILCSVCNKHVEAVCNETITFLPDTLVVFLNIFEVVNGVVSKKYLYLLTINFLKYISPERKL